MSQPLASQTGNGAARGDQWPTHKGRARRRKRVRTSLRRRQVRTR